MLTSSTSALISRGILLFEGAAGTGWIVDPPAGWPTSMGFHGFTDPPPMLRMGLRMGAALTIAARAKRTRVLTNMMKKIGMVERIKMTGRKMAPGQRKKDW